jgi:hypothetical protein
MAEVEALPTRLIGALFVERGLVSESQIRVALEIQRETGQQLGQVLVERFGVSRRELASVVAEQWAKLGGSAGPEDTASWRRLGEIFVERGFVTQDELDVALVRQRQTGERLGEALVAQGVISKFELAGALAEQMAALGDTGKEPDGPVEPATVHQLPGRDDAPDAATPDNIVELAPPKDPVAEEARATSAPRPELESATVDTDGKETVAAETSEAETAEIGAIDAPHAEPTDAEVFETEIPGAEPVQAGTLGASHAELTEPDAFEADIPEADPVQVDALETPAPEILAVGDATLGWAQPTGAAAFETPAPEISEVEAVEPLPTQPADVTVSEAPDAALSHVEAAELPWTEPAGAAALEAPEPEISEVEAVEPQPADVTVFEAPDAASSDVEAADLPWTEPAEAPAFAAYEGVLVGPEPVDEPAADIAEVGEPQPAEVLLTDLRDAIPLDAPHADEPATEDEPLVSCIAFAPTTEGYRLIALELLPEPGETVDVPEIGERVVLRVGRSPIPTDMRLCAYVEEPVTAPVGVAVH